MIYTYRPKSPPEKIEASETQKEKEKEYERLKGLTGDKSNPGRNFNLYKMFFDVSVKSREDRTGYNKYFLTLLFIQTLVAVLTIILGQSIVSLTGYTKMLLIFVYAAAAVISLSWALKLWSMERIIESQQATLMNLEKTLKLPFYMTRDFWDNIHARTYKSRTRRPLIKWLLCHINHYSLPILLFFVFLSLIIFTSYFH